MAESHNQVTALDVTWRVGSHYGIHIYAGAYPNGEPVATAMSLEFAQRIVDDHNHGLSVRLKQEK